MLFGLYVVGIFSVLVMLWVMKKWCCDKSEYLLMLELLFYCILYLCDLVVGLYECGMIFFKCVGGIILLLIILLWVLLLFLGVLENVIMLVIDYSYVG